MVVVHGQHSWNSSRGAITLVFHAYLRAVRGSFELPHWLSGFRHREVRGREDDISAIITGELGHSGVLPLARRFL